MSISREHFEFMRDRWGKYSSWAVWKPVLPGEPPKSNIGDLSIFNPASNKELLNTLKPSVVMIGLNAASRPISLPLSNFHDIYSRANDYKIRYAFQDTPYWGAYMTDVFKGLHETDSQKVFLYARSHPLEIKRQIETLQKEINDLRYKNPLLIAFGDQAYSACMTFLEGDRRIVKITHYAHQIGKEKYREQVLDTIENYLLSK